MSTIHDPLTALKLRFNWLRDDLMNSVAMSHAAESLALRLPADLLSRAWPTAHWLQLSELTHAQVEEVKTALPGTWTETVSQDGDGRDVDLEAIIDGVRVILFRAERQHR